jgi:hypothetical protein
MGTSTCVSSKHPEYNCLIKYSASGLKFTAEKWCNPCKDKYNIDIINGRIKTNAVDRKPRRSRKVAEGS